MNNAIALLLLLVVLLLLLGTLKHQKVRSVLAGSYIAPMHRSSIRTDALILCSTLLYGWVPTFRYRDSTSVPLEHVFRIQPKTRNETEVSETKSRYGDSSGSVGDGTDELAANVGRTSYQDYHDSMTSKNLA